MFNSRLDKGTVEDFFSTNPSTIPEGEHRGCVLEGKTIVSTAFEVDHEYGVMTINSKVCRNRGLATQATEKLLSEVGDVELEYYIEPSNPNGRFVQSIAREFRFKRKR